ncbi:hypothetical protein SAMN04489751_2445 [Brevibacterium sandarakinum]|uniref:LPXTG-motif cell wall anchor domain-containing protein n=1 Tax=Brevibacterium sandarakinum TaxID=629680 RepID=A0A1H1TSW8_BRESA|nr:LPXTG cell wall anchor domain-containing protein [Brevibacterium sandarakinum]SDS62689.1 hypothetical protein SAMN04489751_2445 [Brevibacterium sandarakinum]
MKKLALAPAVALAITGLAASPVMAAPSAPSADTFGQTNIQVSQNDSQAEEAEAAEEGAHDGAETQAIEASVTVSPKEITQTDLLDPGLTVTVTGLEAGDVVSDNLTDEEVTAEGDSVEFTIHNVTGDPAAIDPGTLNFTITIKRGDETEEIPAQVEVIGDDEEPEAPEADPKVSLNTEEISVSDLEDNGLEFTGEGFTPNSAVTIIGAAPQSPFYQDEVTADEDGKISTTVTAPDSGLEPGDYSVYGVDTATEQSSNYAEFTVTEDETEEPKPTTPAAEAELTVSPETISPADFVKEDGGVTLAVENCEPGSDVHYVVTPKGNSNVTAYDNTVQADDEGNASVNVYGTSANDPSAYLGDYDVTVTCGDDEMTGAFTVGEDANAGGSDGNEDGDEDGNGNGDNGDEDGNGGSELPRTGTELTGLVGGAALLLIGGAAVTMTMRRKKVAQGPSEI